jgi:hypothetical protein
MGLDYVSGLYDDRTNGPQANMAEAKFQSILFVFSKPVQE